MHHMRTYGTNTEAATANLVAQVLEGLHYMHQNGVIHRDVKAANLMVDKAGTVVIGDFGLANELYAGGEDHSTVGTPHWRAPLLGAPPPRLAPRRCRRCSPCPVRAVAPEAIEESRWHPTSDIWSLGCTVVELLTGRPPNGAANPYSAMYKACKEPFDAGVPAGTSADGRCAAPCPPLPPRALLATPSRARTRTPAAERLSPPPSPTRLLLRRLAAGASWRAAS